MDAAHLNGAIYQLVEVVPSLEGGDPAALCVVAADPERRGYLPLTSWQAAVERKLRQTSAPCAIARLAA